VADHVEEVAPETLGDVEERLRGLERPHEVPDLLARAEHHPEDGQLGKGRRQLLDARAELPAVERAGDHRAPAGLPPRRFGVVVRKDGRHVELHAGLLGEEIDRLGPVGQEGVDAGGVEMRGRLVLQVGACRAGRLDDALLGGQAGPGDPQPAARAGGRAAEARLLVHDQDLQALGGRGDRRGHAGRSGSDHEDIALEQLFFH
jgi:hypothetical protein